MNSKTEISFRDMQRALVAAIKRDDKAEQVRIRKQMADYAEAQVDRRTPKELAAANNKAAAAESLQAARSHYTYIDRTVFGKGREARMRVALHRLQEAEAAAKANGVPLHEGAPA